MPSESDVMAMIAAVPDRELEPREGGQELPDELMSQPAPVEPVSNEHMIDDGDDYFDPVEIVFPNGARVIATSNDIVEGQVAFQAASPGGSSLVSDDDVVDALFAADVVTSGGVGDFNQSDLEQILADRDVAVEASTTPYVDGFAGGAATSDLESLFQLVNLYMTQPRFDPVALGQVQRNYGPVVDDPSSDPDTAGIDTLLDTRYSGEPRYTILPTPEQFATLDLDGVERVWSDRHGDAGDWVFAFAGDFDMDDLVELAASYIGTLPGDGAVEQWVDVEDPPPAGVVRQEVLAGTGDTSSLTLLFTSPVAAVDGALRANTDVVTEVLTTRLTDVIREELGESYSPVRVRVRQQRSRSAGAGLHADHRFAEADRVGRRPRRRRARRPGDQRPDRQRVRRRLRPGPGVVPVRRQQLLPGGADQRCDLPGPRAAGLLRPVLGAR